MQLWIALFRGINVGGNNLLPMAKLQADLESLNLKGVRTYIQSGNAVFESTAKVASSLAKRIAVRIKEQHGFEPCVVLLRKQELLDSIQLNPFPTAVATPKTLHFFFLEKPAVAPKIEALELAKLPSESFELTDRVFYLYTPDGIGRSKLAAKVEKFLGVTTTARNYRTVDKLAAMVSQS